MAAWEALLEAQADVHLEALLLEGGQQGLFAHSPQCAQELALCCGWLQGRHLFEQEIQLSSFGGYGGREKPQAEELQVACNQE